ncbi:MAG TPA: adenylate kinase [Chitinophagales bacterium]|nr:adenylate kinase [Chitinophagales bacterium]HRK28255.1 adenylate kinase [Chitinophagales bacterium]
MLNLILFGPPGSGKGTQSAYLIEQYGLKHISTGDLLREEKAKESPLGLEAQRYMEQGLLVPDEVVIGMIDAKLEEFAQKVNGFIFDGFPRTVAQAEALDQLLNQKNAQIAKVLSLQVSEEELMRRLLNRGLTSGRVDDNEETIRKRIQEYYAKTMPVAEYYAQFNKLANINGEGNIEEITDLLCAEVNELTSR